MKELATVSLIAILSLGVHAVLVLPLKVDGKPNPALYRGWIMRTDTIEFAAPEVKDEEHQKFLEMMKTRYPEAYEQMIERGYSDRYNMKVVQEDF